MTRTIGVAVMAGVLCGTWPTTASAQPLAPAGPVGQPVLSPYLNLVRNRGASPAAINYYGLVRPQVATRFAIGNLQQQILVTRQEIGNVAAAEQTAEVPTTGAPAVFLNTGGYFLNNQIGAGGAGGVPTTGTGQRAAGLSAPGTQLGLTGSRTTLPYRR